MNILEKYRTGLPDKICSAQLNLNFNRCRTYIRNWQLFMTIFQRGEPFSYSKMAGIHIRCIRRKNMWERDGSRPSYHVVPLREDIGQQSTHEPMEIS